MNRGLYDTVGLRMPITPDEFLKIGKYLKGVKHHGKHIEGHVKNFRVVLRSKGIYLVGSVATFLYGKNIHTLTPEEIPLALYKLGEMLHLDLFKAQVVSLDLAQTYNTQESPSVYFDYLGLHQKLNRHTKIGSLYYGFRTSSNLSLPKQLCFYDKGAEMKQQHHGAVGGRNLLRYELRLRKQLQMQLRLEDPITADMLMDKDFYQILLAFYQSEYEAIEKLPQLIDVIDLRNTLTPAKTAELVFARLLMDRLKQEPDFLSEFHTKAKVYSIYPQNIYYKRFKELLDEILEKYTIHKASNLIEELDDIILSTAV